MICRLVREMIDDPITRWMLIVALVIAGIGVPYIVYEHRRAAQLAAELARAADRYDEPCIEMRGFRGRGRPELVCAEPASTVVDIIDGAVRRLQEMR